eukprot:scaffold119333_cov20-Prasinocladus_malaysianus.AAC.1
MAPTLTCNLSIRTFFSSEMSRRTSLMRTAAERHCQLTEWGWHYKATAISLANHYRGFVEKAESKLGTSQCLPHE